MYLYHYTKLDTAIRFILPYKELRMNQAKNMNDPKESLLHKSEFWEYGLEGRLDEADIATYSANETKILSFCTDNDSRKGYKNHKMWWQYAGSNTGVCLKINFNPFFEENKELIDKFSIHRGCIEYSDHPFDFINVPLHGKLKNSKNDINKSLTNREQWDNDKKSLDYIKKRFFTKQIDWADEKEYRFLTTKDEGEIFLSIKESLHAVYLGLLFNKNYIPSIERLVDCDIIRLDLFNGDYCLTRDYK